MIKLWFNKFTYVLELITKILSFFIQGIFRHYACERPYIRLLIRKCVVPLEINKDNVVNL